MRPKSSSVEKPAEQAVKNIRRAARRHFSAIDKIRIVLAGAVTTAALALHGRHALGGQTSTL